MCGKNMKWSHKIYLSNIYFHQSFTLNTQFKIGYQFKIVPSTKVIRIDEGRVFRISAVDGLLQDPILYARPVAQDSTQLLIF